MALLAQSTQLAQPNAQDDGDALALRYGAEVSLRGARGLGLSVAPVREADDVVFEAAVGGPSEHWRPDDEASTSKRALGRRSAAATRTRRACAEAARGAGLKCAARRAAVRAAQPSPCA